MENVDTVLALLVASLIVLIAIFVRQGQLLSLMTRLLGPPGSLPEELEAEISRLVSEQKKIQAIKLYRKSYGASLAEAEAAVERVARR